MHMSRNMLISLCAVAAVLVAVAGPAQAASVTVPASLNNRALLDTNADELGNTNFAPSSGGVAVGEQNGTPPATAEMKYWLPFALTAAERAMIADAASVVLDVNLNQKQNASGFNADVIGLAGRTSTTAVNSDYQAAGALLVDNAFTAATPTGIRSYDVTAYAQAVAATAADVPVFRIESDQPALLPDGDSNKNNYIVNTQDHSNPAIRPTLTVSPVVNHIADEFDNGNLATGGTNGGFLQIGNGVGDIGTVTETGGQARIRTSTSPNNAQGIVSLHAVDPTLFGEGSRVEAKWVVGSQTGVGANGNATFYETRLLLQGGLGFGDAPYMGFVIENGGQWALVANDGSGEFKLFDGGGLTGGVPTGYEIMLTADLFGWSIVGTGFTDNPVAEGTWPAGFAVPPINLYASAAIQHDTDANPAALNVDSIDVRVTEIPEPITMTALALAGSGLAGYLRRRRMF